MATKTAKTAKKPAKRGRPAKAAPPAPMRRKYADNTKAEAKDLYVRGVGLDRISRYLGVPSRTLSNWQTDERWTEAKDPAGAALDLHREGYPLRDIAQRLEASEKTVRKWLKAAQENGK
jgi:uncharacterized protein YjcR